MGWLWAGAAAAHSRAALTFLRGAHLWGTLSLSEEVGCTNTTGTLSDGPRADTDVAHIKQYLSV